MLTDTFRTPHGNSVRMRHREDTNDGDMIRSCLEGDEYELRSLGDLRGAALDIGAHLGEVAIGLVTDHPGLVALAVEPVPESYDLMCQNIELNNLGDRVFPILGAVGDGSPVDIHYRYSGSESADRHTWVGNQTMPENTEFETIRYPSMTVAELADHIFLFEVLPEIAVLDCEGCEYATLADLGMFRVIAGEYHKGYEPIAEALKSTHLVWSRREQDPVGTFWAVRL